MQVGGVGDGSNSINAIGWVNLTIFSRFNNEFNIQCNALVIKKITNTLPNKQFDTSEWHNIKQLALADPNPGTPARIDLLLGVDIWGEIIKPNILQCSDVEPYAQA